MERTEATDALGPGVTGVLPWPGCGPGARGSHSSDCSQASRLCPGVNHYRGNCCQSQKVLQFSELLCFNFFRGFVLVCFHWELKLNAVL